MTRRGTQRLAALCWTLLLIAGVPAALVRIAGSPLPRHWPLTWPSHDDIAAWLTRPLDRSALATGMLALGWLAWAGFTAFVLADAATCAARIRLPRSARLARLARLRVPSPLRMLTGGLFGVTAVTTTISPPVAAHASVTVDEPATGHGGHPEAAHTPTRTATTTNNTDGRTARDRPSTAVPAAATTPTAQQPPSANTPPQAAADRYVVRPGDTLSAIADTQLGSLTRWPEICQLNWQRHFPTVGGTLDDCDLIYPGWDLRLPTDAEPPTAATPATPPAGPPAASGQPDTTNPEQPAVTPSTRTPAPTEPGDGLACTQPPPTTPSAIATPVGPGIAPTALTTPAPPAYSTSDSPPSVTTNATPDHTTDTGAHPSDEHGVHLPAGSFVPWTLAAAIVAAAAMVWLQRRRRFIPGEIRGEIPGEQDANDEPPQLPPPVVELHRQVARNPDLPTPTNLAERAAAVPTLPLLPPGGVGLVGDGAHAAARAALVSTLASGGPREPDQRGEVVIDASTLTTLFGADVAALAPWPRLHVADDTDHALSILDSRLLHRARVLDEHSLTDLDSLREQAPDEEALPPMLLICQTPPPGARMRAQVSLGLGHGLDVSALLLGEWPPGSTITVSTDGHTRVIDGPTAETIGERVAVLDTADAAAILTTLREAHTGEPPNPVLRTPAVARLSAPATEPSTTPTATNQPATSADEPKPAEPAEPAEPPLDAASPPADCSPRAKVNLRVLGAPTIEDVTLPGRNLRGRAAELAVYLACHPDGADTETIAEYLVPDVRRRQAKQLVHTNASNLRHVLGRAGGPIPGGYVLKRGATARYRLDPTTISVDLWRLRDLLNRARLASAPTRTALLREACDLYTAPLANGCDYEWVEPHREKTRQWGIEAHLLLADDLLTSDPQAACDLLDKAIGLDRYNEELYRKAMHTRHALHDADGIHTLLHALTNALTDLDTEPTETTTELATQLRANLKQQ